MFCFREPSSNNTRISKFPLFFCLNWIVKQWKVKFLLSSLGFGFLGRNVCRGGRQLVFGSFVLGYRSCSCHYFACNVWHLGANIRDNSRHFTDDWSVVKGVFARRGSLDGDIWSQVLCLASAGKLRDEARYRWGVAAFVPSMSPSRTLLPTYLQKISFNIKTLTATALTFIPYSYLSRMLPPPPCGKQYLLLYLKLK